MNCKIFIVFLVTLAFTSKQQSVLSEGFVYVSTVISDLDVELRYYASNNFVGDTIQGYKSDRLILKNDAAKALKLVQDELRMQNICLKVYDGYRPQRAVDHFVVWARDLGDTINKQQYYPRVEKRNLFNEGYIASKAGHSRGSTVDLTLTDGNTGEPLDMGSPYDFFGEESWVEYEDISVEQKSNRVLLQKVMQKHNFRNYANEWWHFTLRWEPFPETYFDFEVK